MMDFLGKNFLINWFRAKKSRFLGDSQQKISKQKISIEACRNSWLGYGIDEISGFQNSQIEDARLARDKAEVNIEKIYEGDGGVDFDEAEEKKMISQDLVRISNLAFSQKKVSEFVSCYFAMLGVGCTIVASEINYFRNLDDKNKDHVITLLIISNLDNLINTGLWKNIVLEILLSLVMSYPSLYGDVYIETANDWSNGKEFVTNDLMLCLMIFCRLHFLCRAIIQLSFYTNPRAQRVCSIYGADATNTFALKSLMIEYSWLITLASMMICLFVLSYTIRLFERQLQNNFYHITTSMWYVLITMTTVGYGDVYAYSHAGRAITVVCAFVGVLIVSLFVICLMNILKFDYSQEKSFNLLQRLKHKDILRIYAVGMLASTYKIKILRRKILERKNTDKDKELRHELRMLRRQFSNHQQNFQKISKVIKNMSDPIADMESLKRNIFTTSNDVEMIRANIARIFSYKSKNTQAPDMFSQKDLERITLNIHRRSTKKRMLKAIPHRA
ncbi:small-conductance calcium-activated potassium channel protein [Stylonychia lemnae]|uniref:Small-conductance calcium-activated potassium channel protein n=1 Tax=Stylonychia lemnae TaxID=5949 RepID=A0A078ARA1_STYLE|nr:small-conductance calcium-activated potassium channel protein [Stylonychia lemnae]|eukprot:CDW84960.1 small-conductance calcium-activated potassium channel protein [Stylonychia lemnae]